MVVDTETLKSGSLEMVAVGCLHLLTGRGLLDFPGSTRAGPSRFVQIGLGHSSSLNSAWRKWFPIQIRGPFWHRVVVPILEDFERSKVVIDYLESSGEMGDLVSILQDRLLLKAQEEGYLPTITVETVLSPEEPGAPLRREPERTYEQFDQAPTFTKFD